MEEEKKEQPEGAKSVKKKKKGVIDMGKGGLLWTIWHLVEAVLLVTGGILAIIYCKNADVQKFIYPVVGGFLIFGGALKILSNFFPVLAANESEAEAKIKAKKALAYDMVIGGSLELALGITLCLVNGGAIDAITRFVSDFIAIILIVAGASLLLFAIGFIVAKLYRLYMPILEIILGLVLIGAGIAVIYFLSTDSSVFNEVILIITGTLLALGGLGMLVDTFIAVKVANELKKAKEQVAASTETSASVTIQEVDFSTEEGKNAAPEAKPENEKK